MFLPLSIHTEETHEEQKQHATKVASFMLILRNRVYDTKKPDIQIQKEIKSKFSSFRNRIEHVMSFVIVLTTLDR